MVTNEYIQTYTDEQIKEQEIATVFKELFDIMHSNDIEFLALAELSGEGIARDTIKLFTFQAFDYNINKIELTKQVVALSDNEFAHFKVDFIDNLVIVYAYI